LNYKTRKVVMLLKILDANVRKPVNTDCLRARSYPKARVSNPMSLTMTVEDLQHLNSAPGLFLKKILATANLSVSIRYPLFLELHHG